MPTTSSLSYDQRNAGLELSASTSIRFSNVGDALSHLIAILDASDEAIVCENADGVITTVNRAAERLFDVSASEVVGRRSSTVVPTPVQAEVKRQLVNIRRGEALKNHHTIGLRKADLELSLTVSVIPVHNHLGEVTGVITRTRTASQNLTDYAKDSVEDGYKLLTRREREIVLLAAGGFKNAEIGQQLSISQRTVETHRSSLMKKLSLRTQTELIRYAIRRGILPDNW